MAKKVGMTVRTVLKAAVDRALIPAYIALSVPLPKAPRYIPKVFTPDQVAAFTRAEAADRFEALDLVAIDSGCRPGEWLALLWSDDDEKAGALTITKALATGTGGCTSKR